MQTISIFFENELSKIFDYTNFSRVSWRFVGNSAYLNRGRESMKIKVSFISTRTKDDYDALSLTALHFSEGKIDENIIKFEDMFGLCDSEGMEFPPHIRKFKNEIDWYIFKPSEKHYAMLAEDIETYIAIFSN